MNPLAILPISQNVWPKSPKDIYFYPMNISHIALVNEPKRRNWFQIFDDKQIRECVQNVLQSLDSRLTYHRF